MNAKGKANDGFAFSFLNGRLTIKVRNLQYQEKAFRMINLPSSPDKATPNVASCRFLDFKTLIRQGKEYKLKDGFFGQNTCMLQTLPDQPKNSCDTI